MIEDFSLISYEAWCFTMVERYLASILTDRISSLTCFSMRRFNKESFLTSLNRPNSYGFREETGERTISLGRLLSLRERINFRCRDFFSFELPR